MKSMKTLVAIGLFLSMLVQPCFSKEQQDEATYVLGAVVVEESSGVKDIAITNTVTSEDILEMGANNVAEALKFTPGIHFSYKNRGYQPIVMQGIGQDQILLLIDGLPVVPGGGELDLNSIPASIISRIEIIKGASSVLYGPNTMGGVINIVTKQGVLGTSGNVRSEIGEHGYNHESGSISYGAEKYSGIFLADHTSRDSYELSNDFDPTYPEVENGGNRQNSKFESLNFWGRASFKPDNSTEYSLNAFSFHVDREVPPNTETTRPFKRKVDDYQVLGTSLTAKKDLWDWITLRGTAFFQKRSQTIEEFNDIDLSDLSQELPDKSFVYGTELFSDMRLTETNTLSLSTHLKLENLIDKTKPVSGTDINKKAKAYTLSFALEDTAKFGPLTAVAGISYNTRKLYDVKSNTGVTGGGNWKDTFDPMFGLSYLFSDGTRIFSSVAKKTTYPAIGSTWDDDTALVYDLDPEQDLIVTLGIEHVFFEKLGVSLAGFHHDITDKISTNADDIMVNSGDFRIYGLETVLSYDFNERLNVGADYSFTLGDGTKVSDSDYGDDLYRHLVGFKFSYRIPFLEADLSTYARYTIDNYDDYGRGGNTPRRDRKTFDMDLSLRKRFDNGFEIIARVKNIIDDNVEYEAGQPLEGRTFRLSLGYYF